MTTTYTVETLAALLECDTATAAERLNNGDLPGLKIGRGWIIPADALHQRLNELAIEQAAQRRAARTPAAAPATPQAPPSIQTTAPVQAGRKRRAPPPMDALLASLATTP